ncbi:MAG TPA: NUDIX hydrolase [Acidimicrobiia bacterium]|nr:NUDIX hydrolase [Acidimicrobiia bacterium]
MSLRLLGRRRLASGVFLHLDRQHLLDDDGGGARRDVVIHPGGVAVLPIEGDRLWLVSQRRAPFGEEMLEIPAGRLEARDSDPGAAAARELEEELGARAQEVVRLGLMAPSPGYTDEIIHLYAATGLTFGARLPDGLEERDATVLSLPLPEVMHRIEEGLIIDGKTQLALLLWLRRTEEK